MHCYQDSVELIRHADKHTVQFRYFLVVVNKRHSIEVCITPAHREDPKKMCHLDCRVIVWVELKAALERACKNMYHNTLSVAVATKCPCGLFGLHLAQLCADEMHLSCLIGDTQHDLPSGEMLLEKMMDAEQTGLCTAIVQMLFANKVFILTNA